MKLQNIVSLLLLLLLGATMSAGEVESAKSNAVTGSLDTLAMKHRSKRGVVIDPAMKQIALERHNALRMGEGSSSMKVMVSGVFTFYLLGMFFVELNKM